MNLIYKIQAVKKKRFFYSIHFIRRRPNAVSILEWNETCVHSFLFFWQAKTKITELNFKELKAFNIALQKEEGKKCFKFA